MNKIEVFKDFVATRGPELYRDMPWRQDTKPYYVLLSEMMLQQTQVSRVKPNFTEFIRVFPTLASLAQAKQSEVLELWSGLGYNRRARYLHQAAQIIVKEYDGKVPGSTEVLQQLPGIGPNTAGAIMAYAYNQPVIFFETNIRSVFMYEFFEGQQQVTDKQIAELIEATIDVKQPREWYWAVMDYGAWLKAHRGNNIRQSAHYKKQSKFAGSKRQLRGQVLRLLATGGMQLTQLQRELPDQRLEAVLKDLEKDQLISRNGEQFTLVD